MNVLVYTHYNLLMSYNRAYLEDRLRGIALLKFALYQIASVSTEIFLAEAIYSNILKQYTGTRLMIALE